jgi:hypothetical protein
MEKTMADKCECGATCQDIGGDRCRYEPLQILEENCWDLRCIDIPTGAGDADIGWNVIEHHMAPPKERIVGTGSSPIEAIQDALTSSTR